MMLPVNNTPLYVVKAARFPRFRPQRASPCRVGWFTEQHPTEHARCAVGGQVLFHSRDRRLGCCIKRVSECAATDCGTGHGLAPVRAGQFEAGPVTRRKEFRFVRIASLPNRSGGMNDVHCGKSVAVCDLGPAGRTSAEAAASFEQIRTCGVMNRPVNPAAAEQGFVGRIDDCVNRLGGDIAANDFDSGHGLCPDGGRRDGSPFARPR